MELCAPISNISHNNILLFDAAFGMSEAYLKKKKQFKKRNLVYKIPENPLNERPGLQRITYSASCDAGGYKKLIKEMSEKALQQKDANVNKSFEYLVRKTAHTPLFLGHRPISVMIDSRSPK